MSTSRAKDRDPRDRLETEEPRGAERRQHERVAVDLEVDYSSKETFLFAYITDISAMGIFIRTNNPEPPGTRLNLKFRPPGSARAMDLDGQVIWVNAYRPGSKDNLNPGMGVQFVDLTAQQRELIVQLVRTFAYLSDEDDKPKGHS